MDLFLGVASNLFNYNPNQIGWWILALVDISFLTLIIYGCWKVLIKTKALQLIQGIGILFGIYLVAVILNLDTVLWLINKLGTVIVIVIVLIYQPELRKIFSRVVRGGFFKIRGVKNSTHIDSIVEAAVELSNLKRGALIVFERKFSLKELCDTGTKLDAEISRNLLIGIFQFDTTLHDGAVIIREGRINAAGCFLPLSEQSDIKKTFGTRHRAALGVSETSDAITLVCSEETGAISLTYESNLYYDLTPEEVKRTLYEYLDEKDFETDELTPGDSYEN